MITYQREAVADVWDELLPLALAHWAETGQQYPGVENLAIDPNKAAYLALDASGFYRLFTARCDGELIGYSTYVVSPSLLHRLPIAVHDVLFIDPAYRRGRTAFGLLKFCDVQLQAEGVHSTVLDAPGDQNTLGPLYARLGYRQIGTTHMRIYE